MEQWIVTILDTCNVYEILRHKERKREREREREEGTSMTKESRGIDNVSLKCFIVGRCRSGRSSNRFPFFSSSSIAILKSHSPKRETVYLYLGKWQINASFTKAKWKYYFEYIQARSSIRLFLRFKSSTFLLPSLEIYGFLPYGKKKNEFIKIA